MSSMVLAAVFVGCGGDSACCDGVGGSVEVIKDFGNKAPIATITNLADNTTIQEGQNLALNGSSSSDDDGTVVAYEWKVDGIVVSTEANPVLTNLSVGTHQVCLTVTDNNNLSSANTECRTVIVTATTTNTPVTPTAVIDLSDSTPPLITHTSHTFNCNNSYDNDTLGTGAEIVACQWDIQSYRMYDGIERPFRDSHINTMNGKTIFICNNITRIVATLTVTDNDGQTHSTTTEYSEFSMQ